MFSWFKKLYSSKGGSGKEKCKLTTEELNEIIKDVDLEGKTRSAVLLCPNKSQNKLCVDDSKIGGIGVSYNEDLLCRVCNRKMQLFIQVFKKDGICNFIPKSFDVFEVYRCTNRNCDGIYDESIDIDTIVIFRKYDPKDDLPEVVNDVDINAIPECVLVPVVISDYPDYQDYGRKYIEGLGEIYKNCEDEIFDHISDNYGPRFGTKFGGYPAWIQNSYEFSCETCGNKKEMIFQLSSDEARTESDNYGYKLNWSPHEVMIGDVGNIYVFMCQSCDNHAITTYWDCS